MDELTIEELSGLLNLAIRGLRRLLRNKRFSYNKTLEEVAEEYQRLSNPVAAFTSDCVDADVDEYVSKDELYSAFKAYCHKKGYPIFSEKRFTEWIKKEVNIFDYRPSGNGHQKRAWKGITLLPHPSPSPVMCTIN